MNLCLSIIGKSSTYPNLFFVYIYKDHIDSYVSGQVHWKHDMS